MNRKVRKSVFSLFLSLFLLSTSINPAVFAENTDPVTEGSAEVIEEEAEAENGNEENTVTEEPEETSDAKESEPAEGEITSGTDVIPAEETAPEEPEAPVVPVAAEETPAVTEPQPSAEPAPEEPEETVQPEETEAPEEEVEEETEEEAEEEAEMMADSGEEETDETETAVESVSLTVKAPEEHTDTYTLPEVSVSESSLAVTGRKWVQDSQGTPLPYSVGFIVGRTYYMELELTAQDKAFSDAVDVTVNDIGTLVYQSVSDDKTKLTVRISVVAVEKDLIEIDRMTLNIVPPAAGTTAKDASRAVSGIVGVSMDAPYNWPKEDSGGALHWYYESDTAMDDNAVFRAGKSYYVHFTIYCKAETGYGFPKNINKTSVTVNNGQLVTKYYCTYVDMTGIDLKVKVTIPDGESSYSITGTNCTPSSASASAGENVTFTAQIPDEYKNDDYSIAGWCVNGVWDSNTDAVRTIAMPEGDLDVMVRYNVSRDKTTDDSKITVRGNLVLTDKATDSGVFSGPVYLETIDSEYDKAGDPSQDAVQAMYTERNEAFEEKISEWADKARQETKTTSNVEDEEWDYRISETSKLDKNGAETEGNDYVIELHTKSGSYGKSYTYIESRTVDFWGYSVVKVTAGEGGTASLTATKDGQEKSFPEFEQVSTTVEKRSNVLLTATPKEGYKFVGWYTGIVGDSGYVESYDAESRLSSSSSVSFFPEEELLVYALFRPIAADKQVEVVFDKEDKAEIYINGEKTTAAEVAEDSEVSVQVIPEENYMFSRISVKDEDGENIDFRIIPHDNDTFTAVYTQPDDCDKVTVTVTIVPAITITLDPNGGTKGPDWDQDSRKMPYNEDVGYWIAAPEEFPESFIKAPEKYSYAGFEITDADGVHVLKPGEGTFAKLTADITLKFLWEKTEKEYSVVEGDGSKWQKGSKKDLTFRVKADVKDEETYSLFDSLLVDGTEVSSDSYTTAEGSVIINLKPEYLETLSAGSHTITAKFSDEGEASAGFTVTEAKKTEPSGSSAKPSSPSDSVVTCQMAGYPSNYSWNEAAKACQPGYTDAGGNFHSYSTQKTAVLPNTADGMNLTVYAWLFMFSMTLALFCGVRLLHEDWEI